MDVEAFSHATDDILEALGLVKTGDRVTLQRSVSSHPLKPIKEKTKKIQLGWPHWNEKQGDSSPYEW